MRPLAPWLLAALTALAAVIATPAAAVTFRAATVEHAARSSDLVVRGTVERITPRYSDDGTAIVTDVEVAVSSAWKGSPGERVVLTIKGGELDGVGEWHGASPTFTVGEEVVVFLTRRGPRLRVNGSAQGKFRVEGGVARPGFGSDEVVREGAQKASAEAWIAEMPVDELERRVRAAK